MLRHTDPRSCSVFALFVVLAAGGCASKTQGEKTIESYAHTRETLSASRRQVALTASSLTRLRTTPPQALKDAFRQYQQAVGQLEKEAADAKWRAQAMQEQSDAHIQAWQEEMKSIKDPTIKASVASRRDAVGTNFSLIRMYADDVRKAYEPFLQSNKDMLQALSLDLSPAAINSLSAGIDKVVTSGKALDDKLWSMENAMDNVAAGKSPLGDMK